MLLRSFADDDLGDEFFYENLFGSQTVSLEQFIAEEVKAFGPFIAVGGEAARTKDDLQVAVRDHYRGEGWRDAIVRWMDAAVFIVVIAGTTPGLEWELNTLFARKHTHKMLVVFPQANRRNRIAWVRRMLHGAPMLESSHGIEDIKGLIAISEGFDRRVLCHWGSEPPGPLEIRTALMNAICERFCAS